MRWSWRPGCPVPIDDLRIVEVERFGFDGRVHHGEVIVRRDLAAGVRRVFRTLFEARFPIARMEPIDAFHGDDARAMAADDTSGFNCRWVTGHPGVWSAHAFGLAIDVNPLENPYVTGNAVAPRGAEPFADRSLNAPGMIHAGDVVVRAFAAIGWSWGGSWSTVRDYQHFSANGR